MNFKKIADTSFKYWDVNNLYNLQFIFWGKKWKIRENTDISSL